MMILAELSTRATVGARKLIAHQRCFSGGAGLGTRQFSYGRVENLSEALPATGLIVPGTDGSKSAAGKIIILDGAPADRTGASLVDERIAPSVAAVRLGTGLQEHGASISSINPFIM
jgi:hypothetical protein